MLLISISFSMASLSVSWYTTTLYQLHVVSNRMMNKSTAVPLNAIQALGGGGARRYSSHSFLTSALDGDE
jgi:hypothetical protein